MPEREFSLICVVPHKDRIEYPVRIQANTGQRTLILVYFTQCQRQSVKKGYVNNKGFFGSYLGFPEPI